MRGKRVKAVNNFIKSLGKVSEIEPLAYYRNTDTGQICRGENCFKSVKHRLKVSYMRNIS